MAVRAGQARAGLASDFVLELYQERLPGNGEDAYYYVVGAQASVVAAFDGSGGSGARRYERWQNKTGAYLASRVMAGAVRDWFAAGEAGLVAAEAGERLRARAARYLGMAKDACGGTSRIRGSLSKDFPTTCSVVVARQAEDGHEALCLNAGDSRCYLLDAQGLHQLSSDDLQGLDAFENLYADGAMTNVVSASGRFELHAGVVPLAGPCVLLAATDGCFGYLQSPMEFEGLLVATLGEASGAQDWERRLHQRLVAVAGDDFTLCGLSLGFGSFAALQQALAPRAAELHATYLHDAGRMGTDEKRALWQRYRAGYEAYL